MTYQDIVREVNKLSLNEQLSLLGVLSNLIRTKIPRRTQPADSLKRVRGMLKPAVGEAVLTDLDAIVTRNIKDYAGAELPIFSPVELLQELSKANRSSD